MSFLDDPSYVKDDVKYIKAIVDTSKIMYPCRQLKLFALRVIAYLILAFNYVTMYMKATISCTVVS